MARLSHRPGCQSPREQSFFSGFIPRSALTGARVCVIVCTTTSAPVRPIVCAECHLPAFPPPPAVQMERPSGLFGSHRSDTAECGTRAESAPLVEPTSVGTSHAQMNYVCRASFTFTVDLKAWPRQKVKETSSSLYARSCCETSSGYNE